MSLRFISSTGKGLGPRNTFPFGRTCRNLFSECGSPFAFARSLVSHRGATGQGAPMSLEARRSCSRTYRVDGDLRIYTSLADINDILCRGPDILSPPGDAVRHPGEER